MFNYLNSKKALTLIEVILYLALFGMFFIVVIRFTLSTSEYNRIATERILLDESSIFVSSHVIDSIEKSTSIDINNSIFSNDSGRLRLITPSGYINYLIVSNRLSIDNNGTSSFLIAPRVGISKFFVEPIYKKDLITVNGVRVTIRIYDVNDPNNFSEFSLSKIL